uniref:SH3 domain-containing protein n=2 Tax=Mesocestoides corti TaxID=53468 RepID=A0A5K3EY76_MESCO
MKECAACGKTVYPIEEIRGLDKVWHKSCFRCQTCNKILGIHNFKGYGGLPYCPVHYPNPKSFTLVKDSPEMQQVAANTRNMSKVQYHKEYENSKGRLISVPEDAMARCQKTIAQNVSRVNYSQPIGPPTCPVQPKSATQMDTNGQIANPGNSGSWYSESVSYPQQTSTSFGPSGGTNGTGRQESEYADPRYPVSGSQGGVDGRVNNEQKDNYDMPFFRPDLVVIGGMRVTGSGMHFRAAYDYDAADYDEVSFIEGDEILHGEPIDEGWMFGTVKRTGKFGMLPSNYVVPIQGSKFSS